VWKGRAVTAMIGGAQRHARDRQFIPKIEMTMRCRVHGVIGRQVGVTSCGMEVWFVGVRSGARSCQSNVYWRRGCTQTKSPLPRARHGVVRLWGVP